MYRALLILTLCGVASSSCSLAVEGVAPPTCSSNSQCAILNELEGIPQDACELYQCSPEAMCEFGVRDQDRDGRVAPECATLAPERPVDCNDAVPSGTEVCNGIDDDCDGVIDERFTVDGIANDPLPPAPPEPWISGRFGGAGFVGYGRGKGALAMVYAEEGTARFGLVSGAMSSGPSEMRFTRAADLNDLNSSALVPGCHTASASGITAHDCRFHEVDLGLTDEAVFTATISRSGCSPGQLRLGYFPRSDAAMPAVIERGPLRRSNAFFGVDVATDGLACTGASRPSGVRGAARPTLAAMELPGGEDQALAAWLGDGFDRSACGGQEVDVEALGIHLQQATFGTTYGWVTASNEGAPQVLGRTTQGGRPGVGVWENTGYVVAFGAPGGGIRVVFVEKMARPPVFQSGAPDDRSGLETGPLAVTDLGVLEVGVADDVVVALGSIRDGGVEVGLAWREGACESERPLRFRQIFVARGGGSMTLDEARSFEVVELAETSVGPPAIVYTFSGMLAPGVARADGRPTGSRENDGGFIVAWADASSPEPGPADDTRILARRISEADGALLNAAEVLVLSAPGDVRRMRPALYRGSDDRVHHAFLATGEASGFHGGPLTCAAPR